MLNSTRHDCCRDEADAGVTAASENFRSGKNCEELELQTKQDDAAGATQDFEEILELVGSQGKFQKRLLYGILCPMAALSPFLGYGEIFMWDIPEHWCHVPGKGDGVSREEWRNLTIPIAENEEQNQCEMFDPIFGNVTQCQFGWEYDETDYSSTIPSQFDWVCEKDDYATQCFTWSSFGAALGTLIFGILADKYGRKPVFFVGCLLGLVFRIGSLFLVEYFLIYKSLMGIRGFVGGALENVLYLLAAEVSGTEYRAWIYAFTWMVWVGGNCAIPFVAMVCRDWWIFGWICSVPGILILVYYPFLYESPRWLISAGQDKKAVKILMEIGKQNGRELNREEVERMVEELGSYLRQENAKEKRSVGILTMFSNWRLALNFWMLAIVLSVNFLLYDVLTLNSTKMAGNRFLNYFYLSLVELPGGYVGGKLVDITGRRWTNVGFFLVCALACLLCTVAAAYPGSTWVVIGGAVGVKFAVTVTSIVASLQATEIFPTPLRSTGTGLATTVASIAGVLGPYMVYTGTVHASLPYGILFICSTVGVGAASFLPETFQQPLPETVKDAGEFGKGHGFWSYLPKLSQKVHDDNRTVKRSSFEL